MVLSEIFLSFVLIITFTIVFLLTSWYICKKIKKKEIESFKEIVKQLKEEVIKYGIEAAELNEKYKQKQFAWDDKLSRQVFEIQQLQSDNEQHVIKDKSLKEKYDKELHFRKSSEVRLGKIGENLAPFLNGWPWKSRQFRFLGNPVDGIQFNDDEIIFVEIKTGKAVLSKSQKKTKELIKAGKVSFVTFKITDGGIKLIKEKNN